MVPVSPKHPLPGNPSFRGVPSFILWASHHCRWSGSSLLTSLGYVIHLRFPPSTRPIFLVPAALFWPPNLFPELSSPLGLLLLHSCSL
ncbi:hypothetical protein GDO78_003117 [Eleutherodactylus coqui]|uniref:Uncharacterized protein n=1 Tax=Eleutherodactylus coqui TaxID=57060 RepID=A0A8J6EWK7_ELECQ|nr:hypothetical protein GDO78_003117 [Eleutherodactylus coqui]